MSHIKHTILCDFQIERERARDIALGMPFSAGIFVSPVYGSHLVIREQTILWPPN